MITRAATVPVGADGSRTTEKQVEEPIYHQPSVDRGPLSAEVHLLALQAAGGNQAVVRLMQGSSDTIGAAPTSTTQDVTALAAEVYEALDGFNNAARALAALRRAGDRAGLKAAFEQRYSMSLAAHLDDQLGGADRVRAFALLESSNEHEQHTALGLALIPIGTRDAEIFRILEGASPSKRREIERRYNAAFGFEALPPDGLMCGCLKKDLESDLALELSNWRLTKSLALLAGDLTPAEQLFFMGEGIAGTHTDSVIKLIQDTWARDPAGIAALERDWATRVQQPVPGVRESALSQLSLYDSLRSELSLEAWLLVRAVLDASARLTAGGATVPDGPSMAAEQLQVARDSYVAATTGESWFEGAGTNEEQATQALATIRRIWHQRIADAEKDPGKRAEAEKGWQEERDALALDHELSGAELDRATFSLAGESSLADEVYLASRALDHGKVVALVTTAWATGAMNDLLREANTKKRRGGVVRPAFNILLTVPVTSGATFSRVSSLADPRLDDAGRGAARLAFELAQGNDDSDLRRAYELLDAAGALRASVVQRYADQNLPGADAATRRFLDFVSRRYPESTAAVDMEDLLDPTTVPAARVERAERRQQAANTGWADNVLAGVVSMYGSLSGEDAHEVAAESLDRLRFLAEGATSEELSRIAAQRGVTEPLGVQQLATLEYRDFQQRLAEAEAVEAAVVEAIATTVELAVSALLTAVTGGAAGGLLLASLSSAAAGMLVREAALGAQYDLFSQENAAKLATAVGGAAFGALGSELLEGAASLEKLGKLGTFIEEATTEAFTQVGSSTVAMAFDQRAPTAEMIAEKAVSMLAASAAAGTGAAIRFGLDDVQPAAQQLRIRFAAALTSNTMTALAEQGAEVARGGGIGDLTGPELLGELSRQGFEAARSAMFQTIGELGAARNRAAKHDADTRRGESEDGTAGGRQLFTDEQLTRSRSILAGLELPDDAIIRILQAGSDIDHVKGQLFEEIMHVDVAGRLRAGAGDPLGVTDNAGLELIHGSRIRDLAGRQLTDGMIGRWLTDDTFEIVTVLEAKAGKSAAQGLRTSSSDIGDHEEFAQFVVEENRAAVLGVLLAANLTGDASVVQGGGESLSPAGIEAVIADKNLRKIVKQAELGGQIRRDVERLAPSVSARDDLPPHLDEELTQIYIEGRPGPTTVRISPTKTRFVAAVPEDVATDAIGDSLRAQGFSFAPLPIGGNAADLTRRAERLIADQGTGATM